MEARIRNGNLIVRLPLEEPRESASRRNLLVASSRGPQQTTARVQGKIVSVIVNAFIDIDPPVQKEGPKKTKRLRGQ